MGGLLSDIGSVCKTFGSVNKTVSFGSDILNNVGKSLGITDRKTYENNDLLNYKQIEASTDNHDIRGLKQVFRDKKAYFTYGKDYKCYNDDFYFATGDGKSFRNSIQDVILYQYQPYKQTQLGTQIRKIEKQFATQKGRENLVTKIKAEIPRSFEWRRLY